MTPLQFAGASTPIRQTPIAGRDRNDGPGVDDVTSPRLGTSHRMHLARRC